jgi:hypothetical protein
MLKGQDVLVLLRLLDVSDRAPVREIAGDLDLDVAGTHRAMRRLATAGLFDPARQRASSAAAEEFLVHAVKYLFPAHWGSETRGVPAAWAAPPLASEIAETSALPPVWPHPLGTTRGIALEPLHAVVPELALAGGKLAGRLALVDGIRAGDARIRGVAERMLVDDLNDPTK